MKASWLPLFFFSPPLFRNNRGLGAQKYFTDLRRANTIQLFVAIKRQRAPAALFFFKQDFGFCKLINKNVLKWFLIKICKVIFKKRCTNLLAENIPHCVFDYEKKGALQQLPYETDKSSHRKCSLKKLFSKILQYSQENICVGVSFFIKFQTFKAATFKKSLQHRCFSVAKFLWDICFEKHLQTAALKLTLRSDCLELCFWTVPFKTILTQYYYKNTSHFQTGPLGTIRCICRLYI